MNLTKRYKEGGNALILVISIMVVLVVIVAISGEYTSTISRNVQRGDSLQTAIAIGDGVLESEFSYWREVCRINTNYAMPTSYMQYIPLPTQAQFPNLSNFTVKAGTTYDLSDEYDPNYIVSNVKVVAVDPQYQPLASSSATPPPGIGMSGASATFNYVASADVTMKSLHGNLVARVRRVFSKSQISPWNYAIFYIDPLEIHPGPAFTVTGPVHTNGDLFTGHSSLNFADKVTFARDWTVGFMPGDGTHPETPASPTYLAGLPPSLDIAHQPFGLDTNRIFNDPSNPNEADHYHELLEPPVSGYTDPLLGMRYFDQAGIIVTVDASNNITYAKSNGDGTTTALSASGGSNSDQALYNMIKGTIATNQNLQDNREAAQVRLATIDLSKLYNVSLNGSKTAATITWKAPSFNGILYLRDSSATSSAHRGFRLKNGQFIPTGGLTVSSPNPVYIQGDFNTGSNVPSNSGTPTNPEGDLEGVGGKKANQGGAYSRQPCSVIADAVNIMSNNWNDSNLLNGLGSRNATATTVNSAIVSGIVATGTTSGSYSGGAENFPRFLENWSSIPFTYYGSMVELYSSMQSNGVWGKGNVYNPPVRNWYFDTNFKLYTPPGSLMVYSYTKGRWSLL